MPVPPGPPGPPAPARLSLFAPRQALPRSVRPFPDETAESYLDRLASANCLDTGSLRACLADGKRSRRGLVSTAALAVLTGVPEETLRRAMPELCPAGQLAAFPWAVGRARPPGAAEGPACRRCAAGRGGRDIYRWQTHENVICLRHRLWTHVRYSGADAQLDLRGHPEIVAANRRHRRLIRRFGRPAVHFAFEQARWICAGWEKDQGWRLPGLEERLNTLARGNRVYRDGPEYDAALYPHAVALARLLASPGWWGPILEEHSSREVGLGDLELNQIDAEIARLRPGATMEMHWQEYQLLRESVLLGGRPGTRRFAGEVRRTVMPGYVWLPMTYYGKCEPLAEWVRDRAASARRSDFSFSRHRPPAAEFYTEGHLRDGPGDDVW